MGPAPEPINDLLSLVCESRGAASPDLIKKLYEQMKRLARQLLTNERFDHTLQSTGLVHEACLRLLSLPPEETHQESQFIGLARKVMRQILIDYARARNCEKRGGVSPNSHKDNDLSAQDSIQAEGARRWTRIPLDAVQAAMNEPPEIILDLDNALSRLSLKNRLAADVVEHRFFMSLTLDETAMAMGITSSQVNELWRTARAWLFKELSAGDMRKG